MKKILKFLIKNKLTLISIGFFAIAVLLLAFGPILIDKKFKNSKTYPKKHYIYEEKFDLSTVPSGYVIWRHGVPKYPMNFNYADSATKYEYFDIGIFDNNNGIIYQVRVPFYAIGIFRQEYVNTDMYRKKNSIPKFPKKQPKEEKKEDLKDDYKLILFYK